MSAEGILKVNHRELILSSPKKAGFEFLRMPHGLQDRIIDGFDTNTMTLRQAVDLIEKDGFKLSHEAIAGYYRAVRRRRSELLGRTIH
ncbi:MAG: hypothetical protein ACLQBD_25660 [Syntrophobacteraceae bacterium]